MDKKEKSELVETNKHIPDSEVLDDIRDTEVEIATMEREVNGFRIIGDRMSMFRAHGRVSGIKERKEFIRKLKVLLDLRKE